MKRRKKISALCIGITTLLAAGCATDNLNRGKVTDVTGKMVTFDLGDTMIGSVANIYVGDESIVIEDSQAKDMILTLVDPSTLKVRGQIAKFGPGPDEITIPGSVVVNDRDGTVSLFDHGQFKVARFNVDSALTSPDYAPTTIHRFTTGTFPDRYTAVNDGYGFARSITINPKGRGFSQRICRYDMTTGELTPFKDDQRMEGLKSLFGVSPTDSLVVEAATNNDIINLYDFYGNLKKSIEGPEFESQVSKEKVFFREVRTTPKYILAGYSGRSYDNAYKANRVIVFTHDGRYVKTLSLGKNINDMGYCPSDNRLYFILNDEPQFAYLDLNGILH